MTPTREMFLAQVAIRNEEQGIVAKEEIVKDCILENRKFSWVMQVDGHVVPFVGHDVADYFAAHYAKLGYNVEFLEM